MARIRFSRGKRANLPTLYDGEPAYTTDTNELFIGSSTGNKKLFDLTQINEQLTYLTTQLNNNGGSSDVSNISKGIEVLSADPTGNDLWEGRIWIVSSNVQQPPSDTTAPIITSSSNGGSFTSAQSVTLSSNEPATIYYTLDGSTPTTSSTVYSSALTISSTSTLKFFGKDVSGNQSTVQSVNFTISIPDTTPPIVTINPSGGTYSSIQSVTLTANENSTIYYTLNGTTPTTSSTVYNSPISVSSTTTINYFAKDTAGNQSAVQTVTYTINSSDTTAPNPVTNLTAGTPTSNSIPVTWTLSTSNDVANYEVAYSSNGGSTYTVSSNVVNASSTSYTVTGLTSNTSFIVRVVAIDTSNNRSVGVTVSASTIAVADTTPPNSVTNLAVGTVTDKSVALSWTASTSADIDHYEVWYMPQLDSWTASNTHVTSTSYTVTNLNAYTNYTFKVYSVDTSGNKDSGVTVTAQTAQTPVTAPTISVIYGSETATTSTIHLDTAATSTGTLSYDLYADGALKTSGITFDASNQYQITGQTTGWHNVVVRAVNGSNYADSNTVKSYNNAVKKLYDFASSMEFEGYNQCSATLSSGILNLTINSGATDPYMIDSYQADNTTPLNLDISGTQVIELKMLIPSGMEGSQFGIFYKNTIVNVDRWVNTTFIADGAWHVYRVDMSTATDWTGATTHIRIDIPNSAPALATSRTVQFDYIQIR